MKKYKKLLREYIMMAIGSLIYSMGIALFLDPNKLAPGGVTGISIILSNFLPLETGTFIFLVNIPIVIIGFLKLGRKLIWRSLYCLTITSVMIDSINGLYGRAVTDDLMISALAGATFVGVGIGIIMKQEATTAGTDIIVRLLRKRYPHIKTGALFSGIDFIIVAASAILFKDAVVAMYALVSVVFCAIVMDKVLYGTDEAKLIYIISDHSQSIAGRLLEDLDVGVTYIQGRGAYSGKDKEVIMAVMRKALAPKAEEVVKEVDPTAFMIVSSANEIYGEGYKNIFSEKL